MNDLPVIPVPANILRQKAQKVTEFGPALHTLAQQMVQTMRNYNGMGLAAPQVNESKQLIVLEYEPTERDEARIPLMVLANPVITNSSKETEWMDEGCLSIPTVEVPVKRPSEITVLAQDLEGNRVKIRAKDLLSRILQHEIDHTNGILMVDRAYPRLAELRNLRIMFMGTPKHVGVYLTALAATEMRVVGVITETDKPAGRKQVLTSPPIKKLAELHELPVFQFESLKDKAVQQQIRDLQPDLVIVAAYGKIIPAAVLEIPKHGFLNIHYSLLPALRGASPHQTAVLQGLKETGYTIFKLDAGMDTGPILIQKKVAIERDDTSQTLLEKMARLSAATLLEVLPGYVAGERRLRPQNNELATATRLFTKEDGLIDWNKPVEQIDQQIRALQPWPIAYTIVGTERVQILLSHVEEHQLVIDVVQPAGKQPMTFADYLRGDRENRLTFFEKLGKIKLN